MKKNFFKKKLASGLALALVVASLSPAGVSAATATKIVKQDKSKAPTVLYVGNKGTDYTLSSTSKANKYSWKISNSKIATINAKTGVVTPKAPGTVTIKVTARNAKTNKWLKDFSMKLYIKQRATSVDIASDDFSLAVGAKKDLNAVKTPKASTDVVVYGTSDAKIATVNAKTGVVTAVAPGTATITVYSKGLSSSANTSKYNKTDAVKVTVLDGIQGVKQITASKLEVTLATDQSKTLTKDNLVITDANGVKQIIKDVTFSTDGKVAKVELFVPLTDKVVYTVSYADTSKDITASIGDVAKIEIASKTVQFGNPTKFDVKLYDANGVDVTSDTALDNNVTFSYDASKAYIEEFNSTDKYKITVFNFNEAVTVTATYHTYKYVDGQETTFESKAVINSVEELPTTAADVTYTLAKGDADWKSVKTSIPASDAGYQLFIKAKSQEGTDLTEADFTYESTDIDVLTVIKDTTGSDTKVYVYPGKTGTAYVKATYGKTVKLLAVTVGAEAKVATVVPDVTNVTLYNVADADSATIKLTGKDQYGSEVSYAGKTIGVDHVSGDSNGVVAPTTVSGSNEITFAINGTVGNATDGTNTYKLTFLDKVVIVYVKVVNVTNHDVSYINVERSTATVDAILKDSTTGGTNVTFKVFGYNTSGQKVQLMNSANVVIKFNGSDVNSSSAVDGSYTSSNGVATFAALDTSGATVTQAAVGTYTVEASASVAGVAKKAQTSFTVSNTQAVPVIVRTTTKVDAGTILDLVQEGFDAKVNGVTLDDSKITAADVVVGSVANPGSAAVGDTVYVKSITVTQNIGGKNIAQKINVGLSLIAK